MVADQRHTLVKLSDSNLTLADPAADVRGREVLDRNGDDIGKVEDLMVDPTDRKVRYLVVGKGGFLGIGEKKVMIPVDVITKIDDKHIHINKLRDFVLQGPGYDPTLVPDEQYWANLYGYYGYAPYWTPGYLPPPYPYYP